MSYSVMGISLTSTGMALFFADPLTTSGGFAGGFARIAANSGESGSPPPWQAESSAASAVTAPAAARRRHARVERIGRFGAEFSRCGGREGVSMFLGAHRVSVRIRAKS